MRKIRDVLRLSAVLPIATGIADAPELTLRANYRNSHDGAARISFGGSAAG